MPSVAFVCDLSKINVQETLDFCLMMRMPHGGGGHGGGGGHFGGYGGFGHPGFGYGGFGGFGYPFWGGGSDLVWDLG